MPAEPLSPTERLEELVADQGSIVEAVVTRAKPDEWGRLIEYLDPVVRIIVDNGFHEYEFGPDEIQHIEIRLRAHAQGDAS